MRITKKEVERAFQDWLAAHNITDGSYRLYSGKRGYCIRHNCTFFKGWSTGREMYFALTFATKSRSIVPKPKTMDDVKPGDKVRYIDEEYTLGPKHGAVYTVSKIFHGDAGGAVYLEGVNQLNWWYKRRFEPA